MEEENAENWFLPMDEVWAGMGQGSQMPPSNVNLSAGGRVRPEQGGW